MDQVIESLRTIVGARAVLCEPEELLVYECDGLPQHKQLPRAVVFPESTEATAEIMRTLARFDVPFTPRGAGTGLSGGALALNRGVVIELARMRKILEIDAFNRTATVQTGVVNLHVSRAVAHLGLHYVPDPSSQPTCTIGGNIAENAGGIHCLKYGTTTDHVLAARVVLSTGEILDLTSGETGRPGYDLLGVFVGSEGTFGIATEATLRLTPIPPAVRTLLAEFAEVDDASHAVSAIIAAGVMPAALEMMDREIIRAIEASIFAAGLPSDIGAALLIELDGLEAGIDAEAERVKSICLKYGARNCRLARDDNERKTLWAARKGAFGAIGRIAPDSMIQDAVVPRSRLPEVMQQSYRIASKYGLLLANVFHAGDGNLHPFICFDSRSPDEVRRVKEAGRELMETCVNAGGSITGEHGVGFDKREYLSLIFSEDDMDAMLRVRAAFDPTSLCNPGKIIPMLRGCGEARAVSKLPEDWIEENPALPPRSTNRGAQVQKPEGAQSSLTSDATRLSEIPGASNPGAAITITPKSVIEIVEVMKRASESGLSVVPAGAQTWLKGSNQRNGNLVISTLGLNRIVEHEPADLVATAEAGVSLSTFNHELARNGQWLPLDPPDNGAATLGGVVATGLAGPRQFGYGPPRRFVIGMKVVLADGTQIKVGGRVVKNVAGYDLCKLFTGSYGTLGIISEITFKLRPVPETSATLLATGTLTSLLKAGQALMTSALFPVAIEILSPAIVAELNLNGTEEHALLIQFAGTQAGVAQQVERAVSTIRRDFATANVMTREAPSNVWRSIAASETGRERLSWRGGIQPGKLAEVICNLTGRWHAGVGSGIVSGDSEGNLEEAIRLQQRMRSLGGWLTIQNSPAELDRISDEGDPGIMRLMQRIKNELDPCGILPELGPQASRLPPAP